MTDTLALTAPLTRWQGDRGTYHLVVIEGDHAEAIAMHARLQKLEYGTRRGFGSVKVMARIGDTRWKSSVFPQDKQSEWILLVSKKVMRAEDLAEGDPVTLELELL
ncbi:DUF1905 domain-containing protein [Erythrobacter litoralis]|uniref:DUF1905 domain-containing protein n=1 Tax=Erythrobacter litoralis (strain HTCC2594) TaxID=314225 RepID=Q2N8L9_ERYLH|nr:DUF1905 domain-containing protein [Erythrobacter litoralis]ABC63972.1 hypothetical protein ELI_09400 [Erythrobacter litoralis HTCC2594]